MSRSAPRRYLRSSERRSSYDVVIVGGGVHGLATAYYLASTHGITDVAVLERAYVGAGGSGRNTQVIRANYNTPPSVAFYREAVAMYQHLSQELDYNILYAQQGEIDLVHSEDALRVERDRVALNRAMGVDTTLLDPDEVQRLCPLIDLESGGTHPVLGASYHAPGAFARHDAVVWGYAQAASSLGVAIHPGIEVTGLVTNGDRCIGVEIGPSGMIHAGAVLLAAGGYSSLLAAMAGIELPLVTHPLQAFVTESYGHVLDHLVSSFDPIIYVSQTQRGELVVGAEIEPYASYSTASTYGFLERTSRRCIEMLPFMASARVMRQWTGVCDMTPDSSPILGRSPVKGLFLSAGWGTWGFKAAPIGGTTMAELIATGKAPAVIEPFAPDRFENDRMVADASSAGTH